MADLGGGGDAPRVLLGRWRRTDCTIALNARSRASQKLSRQVEMRGPTGDRPPTRRLNCLFL